MIGTPSSPHRFVMSSTIVNELLRWTHWEGLDTPTLIKAWGISAEALQDPAGQHDALLIEKGLCQVLAANEDPLLGLHMSPKINITALGIIGFIAQTSTTLGDLINSVNHFGNLVGDVGIPSLHHEPGSVIWTWDCHFTDPLMIRHATECLLGCWAGLLRLRKQSASSILLAVRFRHSAPSPALEKEYQRFFGCPVYFDQPISGLVLPSRNLADAMSLADPNLHQTLALHAEQQMQAQQKSTSLPDKVRAQLRAVLARGMTPVRDDIAEILGLSGRSLHRKLEESGCNFRELMDEIRLDIARAALRTPQSSVASIGEQLGFTESQSFIRWFKKMEGVTPGEFRMQQEC